MSLLLFCCVCLLIVLSHISLRGEPFSTCGFRRMDDLCDWCDLQLASLSGAAGPPKAHASDERADSSDPRDGQAPPSAASSPLPPATQPTSSRSSRAKSKEPADDEPWGEPWFLNVKAADIPSFAQLYNVQEKVLRGPSVQTMGSSNCPCSEAPHRHEGQFQTAGTSSKQLLRMPSRPEGP